MLNGAAEVVPLSKSEQSFLGFERGEEGAPQFMGALIRFESTIEVSALEERLSRVIKRFGRLQCLLREGERGWYWEEHRAAADSCVVEETLEDENIFQRVAEVLSESQALQEPLWKVFLFSIPESKQTVLFLRVHHSLGDGLALSQIISELFDEPATLSTIQWRSSPLAQLAQAVTLCVAPKQLAGVSKASRSGSRRRIAKDFFLPKGLGRHVARSQPGAYTYSLAVTLRALARYSASTGDAFPPRMIVPARKFSSSGRKSLGVDVVPLSLLIENTDQKLLQFIDDLHQQFLEITSVTSRRANEYLDNVIGLLPLRVKSRVLRYLSGQHSGLCTFLPLRHLDAKLGGVPVRSISGFAPLLPRQGFSVVAVSTTEAYTLGVMIDPAIIKKPDLFFSAFEMSCEELRNSFSIISDCAKLPQAANA